MYPIDKYRFFTNGAKVVAVSTYAGKTVRGIAKCDVKDKFSLDKGKELAAARCAAKIAKKRLARAQAKCQEAYYALEDAQVYVDKMEVYLDDAYDAVDEAENHLYALLEEF